MAVNNTPVKRNNWLPPIDRFDTALMGWFAYGLTDELFFETDRSWFLIILLTAMLTWQSVRLYVNREQAK